MKKILLTGGSGFLGSRLAWFLRSLGYEVDCPSSGELDVTVRDSCRDALRRSGPDAVVHCAALASTAWCEEHPRESLAVNVNGCENLAAACAGAGLPFVYMSSDQVYGGTASLEGGRYSACLLPEDAPLDPANVYGRHKLLCEQRVREVLPSAVGLRLSWMWDLPESLRRSPGETPFPRNNGILLGLLAAAAKDATPFRANPREHRGQTWVWEVVRNIELLLRSFDSPDPVKGGVYNFGHPDEADSFETATRLAESLWLPGTVVTADPSAPARNLSMNISRIREYGLDFPDVTPRMAQVLSFLREAGIPFRIYYHPPLFTVPEALAWWKDISATHCKNLFLRNHKGDRHYLVSVECHKEVDIHALESRLGQGKLSFASPERLRSRLGVSPGSIGPLSLVNDLSPDGHAVKYFLDSEVASASEVSFHPGDNTASVVLSGDGFRRFLSLWGGETEILEA